MEKLVNLLMFYAPFCAFAVFEAWQYQWLPSKFCFCNVFEDFGDENKIKPWALSFILDKKSVQLRSNLMFLVVQDINETTGGQTNSLPMQIVNDSTNDDEQVLLIFILKDKYNELSFILIPCKASALDVSSRLLWYLELNIFCHAV